MFFWKFICPLFFIAVSCNGGGYSNLTNRIYDSYSKEMKNKYGLILAGTGGAMNDKGLKKLYLCFDTFLEVDIKKGREIFIDVVEGLVSRANDDLKGCSKCPQNPITWRNVKIDLGFIDNRGHHVGNGNIAYITLIDENIVYCVHDEHKEKLNLVYRESYQDALKIVNECQ